MLTRGARCLLVLSLLAWSGTAWAQTKMTIATGVDPVFSAYYVAQQEGLFKKHGLDVRINTGPSGSAMVSFLVNGQIESAFGSEIAGGAWRPAARPRRQKVSEEKERGGRPQAAVYINTRRGGTRTPRAPGGSRARGRGAAPHKTTSPRTRPAGGGPPRQNTRAPP